MAMESERENIAEFSRDVVASLEPLGVYALDVTGDEMAKTHARHLAGGRPGELAGERILRFEFPENAGALHLFLGSLRKDWFLTMLHYRNHGGQVGKVLAGVRVPLGEEAAFSEMLDGLGYTTTRLLFSPARQSRPPEARSSANPRPSDDFQASAKEPVLSLSRARAFKPAHQPRARERRVRCVGDV